jgi:hypothetical protein
MSMYDPLNEWLRTQSATGVGYVPATFKLIEGILKFTLPDAAMRRPQWWANETGDARHAQHKAWRDAGFETRNLDLAGESVEFVKPGVEPRRTVQFAHTYRKSLHDAVTPHASFLRNG